VTSLDITPHPPLSQLLPAQGLGDREKAKVEVPHWEYWETPSEKCRI